MKKDKGSHHAYYLITSQMGGGLEARGGLAGRKQLASAVNSAVHQPRDWNAQESVPNSLSHYKVRKMVYILPPISEELCGKLPMRKVLLEFTESIFFNKIGLLKM